MPFDKTTFTEDLTTTQSPATEAEPEVSVLPIYAGLALFLAVMVGSVAMFGLPGLYIPAVAFVPIMFMILIRITMG